MYFEGATASGFAATAQSSGGAPGGAAAPRAGRSPRGGRSRTPRRSRSGPRAPERPGKLLDELKDLAHLKEGGFLTSPEFVKAKSKLLGSPAAPAVAGPPGGGEAASSSAPPGGGAFAGRGARSPVETRADQRQPLRSSLDEEEDDAFDEEMLWRRGGLDW